MIVCRISQGCSSVGSMEIMEDMWLAGSLFPYVGKLFLVTDGLMSGSGMGM